MRIRSLIPHATFRALIVVTLAMWSPVPGQAQTSGNRTPEKRDTFEDWVVECYGTEGEEAPCQAYQRVLTQNAQVAAMTIAITRRDIKGPAQIEIALPLGVNLATPPVLAIGDDLRIDLAWSRCLSEGCLVQGRLSQAILASLMAAGSAGVDVGHPTGDVVTIPISTVGFKDAMKRLEESNCEAEC